MRPPGAWEPVGRVRVPHEPVEIPIARPSSAHGAGTLLARLVVAIRAPPSKAAPAPYA